jgi:hypothetical protein
LLGKHSHAGLIALFFFGRPSGNENLEIQWRLATLSEAKEVTTQYHKYLSENSLIKSIPELFESLPARHSAPTNGKQNTAEEEPLQQSAAEPGVHPAKARPRSA